MTTTITDQISERLHASDVRLTSGRREVLEALTHSPGPVSATELHAGLDGAVPLSSIYRTLAVLCDAAVATPHHGRGGVTRYELAEPLQRHHHHLVCVECGRIDDVEFASEAEKSVHTVVASVAAEHGFRAIDHAVEIEGVCGRCS